MARKTCLPKVNMTEEHRKKLESICHRRSAPDPCLPVSNRTHLPAFCYISFFILCLVDIRFYGYDSQEFATIFLH
ncbi:hypothetical protein [Desulfonatronum parangueonense]